MLFKRLLALKRPDGVKVPRRARQKKAPGAPHKPYWFRQVPLIIRMLDAAAEPLLDRKAVENLFQVGQSEAGRLLKRTGAAFKCGGANVVPRWAMLEWLKRLERDGEVAWEQQRAAKVASVIAEAREKMADETVRPIVRGAQAVVMTSTDVDSLPPGLQISPGKLTIEFFGYEDLLYHVGALVHALANDPIRIRTVAEDAD